jgi:hypothetical protein
MATSATESKSKPNIDRAAAVVAVVHEESAWSPASLWSLVALAGLATIWLTFAGIRIESAYLNHFGFFFDPAAYYLHNIEVYRFYEQQGWLQAIMHQITSNPRDPGRILPHLLLAPKSLIGLWAHMWTQMPFIWGFLTLLSVTVYQRTRSILLSIASIALFVAIPFLYDPMQGVAAYWLDLTPACALGSAAICLIQYARTRHNGWMLAFGAFASACALCRWSSSFYVLVFAVLAIPALLAHDELRNWRSSARAMGFALAGALPGLVFLLAFWQTSLWYYKTFGFAFGAPLSQSFIWTSKALNVMFGAPILAVVVLLTTANLLCWLRRLTQSGKEASLSFIALWLPLSVLLFVCLIVKAVDGYHPLVYFAPALFVSTFCPLGTITRHRIQWQAAALALIVAGLAISIQSYEAARRLANSTQPQQAIKKASDTALANLIVSTRSRCFTQFDTETVTPQMEVFFFHGSFCDWVSYFSIHESYLKFIYEGESPETMAESAYGKVKEKVELVAVFADPEQAAKPGVFNNVYSATVSKAVAQRLPRDPAFRFVGYVDGQFGKLAIYKNTLFRPEPHHRWAAKH